MSRVSDLMKFVSEEIRIKEVQALLDGKASAKKLAEFLATRLALLGIG